MGLNTKKVAIICNYKLLPNRIGGMDYFFWAFDEACKKNNIEVHWFFPNVSSHGNYSQLKMFAPDTNTSLEAFALTKIDNSFTYVFTHFVELCTSFFCKLKKQTNAKIIAVDHNPRPLNGYPLNKRIKKRLKGWLYSKCIDQFIGVSNYTKQALIQDFGSCINSKVKVVFNGLDEHKFKKKTNFNSYNKFIVASHLRKEKGIQDLILAAQNLKNYNFTIDIYGDGYYKEELEKMAQKFTLKKNIHFKGSISNLYEIYCDYDYLIHPSHGETFGYTVVESLLCNLPVITTTNHGNVLGMIVENKNGFLYSVKDVKGLTSLLKAILEKEKKITEMSKNVIDDKFTINSMVNNYMVLIQ